MPFVPHTGSSESHRPSRAVPVRRIRLRSPTTRIEGTSDEILRNIIGEQVPGPPGDICVDKTVAFRDIPTNGRS